MPTSPGPDRPAVPGGSADPAPGTEVVAAYGPDIPTEADLRLLGDVRGKRVLDLGCGEGGASVAFARRGATVIGLDPSADALAGARALAAQEEVRLELRQGDPADLAFLRADSIDAVFAAGTMERVEDMGRLLRQVHRVLKVGAPLVLSVTHPVWRVAVEGGSSFDPAPSGGLQPRSFAELSTALFRASYRVDTVLEPEPVAHAPRSGAWDHRMATVARTLILRARKEGS